MIKSKQSQKTGDNSNPIQAENIIINNVGLSQDHVEKIVEQKLEVALHNLSQEAKITGKERGDNFQEKLIEKMIEKNALEAFKDPAFQVLLIEAQKSAVSTDRTEDYESLAELLAYRFEKKDNRKTASAVARAIPLVHDIDDEALLALTAFHSVTVFRPATGNVAQGLKILDDLFKQIMYAKLPSKKDWQDHLDMLNVARINNAGRLKKLEEYWYQQLEGYVLKGIKKGSESHSQAKDVLKDAALPETLLQANSSAKDYLVLPYPNKQSIRPSIVGSIKTIANPKNKKQIAALEEVYDLYDGDKITKKEFVELIDSKPNLKKLRIWWSAITDRGLAITPIGRVLAHSNAQRIDNSLPDLG